MLKLTLFARRRVDVTPEEFLRHWTKDHMALVRSLPEFGRLVRRCILQQPAEHLLTNLPRLPFDGYAELWFDNEADLGVMLRVIGTNEDVARDAADFTDPAASQLLVTNEIEIM